MLYLESAVRTHRGLCACVCVCVCVCVCLVNVSGGGVELEGEVTGMWLVRKLHGLLSDTVYSLSVCAVTSVGRGPSSSVSAATKPPSCQSAFTSLHLQLEKLSSIEALY